MSTSGPAMAPLLTIKLLSTSKTSKKQHLPQLTLIESIFGQLQVCCNFVKYNRDFITKQSKNYTYVVVIKDTGYFMDTCCKWRNVVAARCTNTGFKYHFHMVDTKQCCIITSSDPGLNTIQTYMGPTSS